MKLFLIVLSLIFISSCRSIQQKKDSESYLVIGCEIYDLNGTLRKSYPGVYCIFQDDGSLISYDASKLELTKYDKFLKKIWAIKKHFHHYITVMKNGNILANSSIVKNFRQYKKVRMDQVIIISQAGEVLNTYTFGPEFSFQRGYETPMKTKWDDNLDFDYEFTHLAASSETDYDIGDIPKGSILLTLNAQINTTLFLDSTLTKILSYQNFPYSIHDAQVINNHALIFFQNNRKLQPSTEAERSGLVIFDLIKEKEVYKFSEGSYGIYGGSVQKIDDDIFLMSDMASKHSPVSDFKGKTLLEEHLARKSRISLFSRTKGMIKEIHFKTAFNNAKVQMLDKFLQNNIGP